MISTRFFILFALAFLGLHCSNVKKSPGFVKVSGSGFVRDGKPYTFMGTNFWYGLNLGSTGEGGDRDRLIRELDRLAEMGVKNLRVMAGTEGPDTEGYRMLPSMQVAPGKYNEDVLKGLDFLLVEMGKRDMLAVMCLNNYWNWSGGVGQYLVWAGAADSIPNPSAPGGDWRLYQEFASSFYSHPKATALFEDHIRFIVNRKNHLTGKLYKEDPVIMSWELANEPRGSNNIAGMQTWIRKTSDLIRSLDPNHLITTGSEGNTSGPAAGTDVYNDHNHPSIDYATIHMWVQNWDFYNPYKADSTYEPSVRFAHEYISGQLAKAKPLNKPVVLEEYGISRDTNSHEAGTPVTIRDKFYEEVFQIVDKEVQSGTSALAGVNFWAWGGEGRPSAPKAMWKKGDAFIGDPPHEAQGWYSVFDTDSSTIRLIRRYAEKINN
jgi:mannan endo-1,4-beta-mannosidase